jgi:hypothetical protein
MFTLRQLAHRVFTACRAEILRLADPLSFRLARRMLTGASRSWLDEDDRPAAYDDVGRGVRVPDALGALGASRYERALLHALAGRPLELGGDDWIPIGVRGWSRVVFRRDRDGARAVLPLDALVDALDRW